MADKDFRVTMIDPDGGEFVAGSPEVVARLTSQGYRQQGTNESGAAADEREQAAANVPAPKDPENADGSTQTADADGGPASGPDFENVGTETADKDANAPKPTGRRGK